MGLGVEKVGKKTKKMDKKKVGAVLLIVALVLSLTALVLYFSTDEKVPTEPQVAPVGGNSANVQLIVEPNGEEVNGQG